MKTTLTFQTRSDAERFTSFWAFYSKRGHDMSAGTKNVKVTLYDVTDQEKEWIDGMVNKIKVGE